jgi:hypothetical protein
MSEANTSPLKMFTRVRKWGEAERHIFSKDFFWFVFFGHKKMNIKKKTVPLQKISKKTATISNSCII